MIKTKHDESIYQITPMVIANFARRLKKMEA
jgi:hypothetical protein